MARRQKKVQKKRVATNLEMRRADYSKMIAEPRFKAPEGAFHRPGSNKK